MMLKRLGMFAVLAGFFALAMGGIRAEPRDEPQAPEGMVLIPAGTFDFGTKEIRTVHIDAFFMDEHEVTTAEYKEFLLENPRWQKHLIDERFHDGPYLFFWDGNNYPSGKADHPVVYVSWYAAMAYAAWAGKRLPTSMEWEYAARGGLARKEYPWGDTITPKDANYDEHVGGTTAVGRYAANGYGLYDMSGNVWEWCLDKDEGDVWPSDNSRNPIAGGQTIQWILDNFKSIPPNSSRVLRGGCWNTGPELMPIAYRGGVLPAIVHGSFGFRCVRDIPR